MSDPRASGMEESQPRSQQPQQPQLQQHRSLPLLQQVADMDPVLFPPVDPTSYPSADHLLFPSADHILFPSADHMSIDRLALDDPSSPGGLSLSDAHGGDTPDPLAALFPDAGSNPAPDETQDPDADKLRLLAHIAHLQHELDKAHKKQMHLGSFIAESDERIRRLLDENCKLAKQLSEMQQSRQDQRYRPFTNTDRVK